MKTEFKKGLWYMMFLAIAIILYHSIGNWEETHLRISEFASHFSVFGMAMIIAFILNIPLVSIESVLFKKTKAKQNDKQKSRHRIIKGPRKWIQKLFSHFVNNVTSNKGKRGISLFLTLILVSGVIAAIVMIIAPQLLNSIQALVSDAPGYVDDIGTLLAEKTQQWHISAAFMDKIMSLWVSVLDRMGDMLLGATDMIYGYVSGIVAKVFNFIISLILALYILVSKEMLMGILDKVYRAYFPKTYQKIVKKHIGLLVSSFQQFIRGQVIEALILGVMCYAGMRVFGFEYPLLISVIIGITNVVPMFGPYIGGIPSVLLLLTINPISALWFILFIIVLQQLEGNIIYPKVVGNSMGVNGFWILSVVILGNNFFGIPGILLGIPIFSTVYIIFKDMVEKRLSEQEDFISKSVD